MKITDVQGILMSYPFPEPLRLPFWGEAVGALLEGETAEGLSMLRDLVHAEFTFKELARQTGLESHCVVPSRGGRRGAVSAFTVSRTRGYAIMRADPSARTGTHGRLPAKAATAFANSSSRFSSDLISWSFA
jgi:hypothetical protein